MKKILKKIKNIISVYFGIASIFRYLNRNKAIILTYHIIYKENANSTRPTCFISESEFSKHIKWLVKKYQVVPLSTIVDCILTKKNFPKKALGITFDDGYSNFFHVAYPILKKFNIPSTIYLSAGLIDTKKLFWFDMIEYLLLNTYQKTLNITIQDKVYCLDLSEKNKSIQELVNLLKKTTNRERKAVINHLTSLLHKGREPISSGDYLPLSWREIKGFCNDSLIAIGSHTIEHIILTSLSTKEVYNEVYNSKLILENNISEIVEDFSYPNGKLSDFDEVSKDMLKKAGYRSAATTIEDFNTIFADVYELKRFGASIRLSELISKISGFDNFLFRILRYSRGEE